jgi:hypothetical protein
VGFSPAPAAKPFMVPPPASLRRSGAVGRWWPRVASRRVPRLGAASSGRTWAPACAGACALPSSAAPLPQRVPWLQGGSPVCAPPAKPALRFPGCIPYGLGCSGVRRWLRTRYTMTEVNVPYVAGSATDSGPSERNRPLVHGLPRGKATASAPLQGRSCCSGMRRVRSTTEPASPARPPHRPGASRRPESATRHRGGRVGAVCPRRV